MDILQSLNSKQREAVEYTEGPMLILAGAGSGKTHTIMSRIAYLLSNRIIKPSQILAITFTKKAANEMKTRIKKLNIDGYEKVWISTIHSLCWHILQNHRKFLGYKTPFRICEFSEQKEIMNTALENMGITLESTNYDTSFFLNKMTKIKNGVILNEEDSKVHINWKNYYFKDIRYEYDKELRLADLMDFDDLLVYTKKLFLEHPEILEKYQNRFKYVFVDEFQDINSIQYELIKMISQKNRNLCVVGDDDQAIYGWRGSKIDYIIDFPKEFPGAKIIKLEENYRSTPEILTCGNTLISHNVNRTEKSLFTKNTPSSKGAIQILKLEDAESEAWEVAKLIKEKVANNKYNYQDICVLFRTNAQSRYFEEAFIENGIPYRIIGSTQFYQRKEIKDMLAYLSLLVDPTDTKSFLRVINLPKRGIGEKSIEKLKLFAQQEEVSLLEACKNIEKSDMTSAVKNKFLKFFELIYSIKNQILSLDLNEIVNLIYHLTGYKDMLEKKPTSENQERKENIQELITAAKEYADKEGRNLEYFLSDIALSSSDPFYSSYNHQVDLMTFHRSKGLEYSIVFMCGLEDGLFPSYYSANNLTLMEEERRLCYVGITRAKEILYLTYALERMRGGYLFYQDPSPFFQELPEDIIEEAKNTGNL